MLPLYPVNTALDINCSYLPILYPSIHGKTQASTAQGPEYVQGGFSGDLGDKPHV